MTTPSFVALIPQPPVTQPFVDSTGRLMPVWRNYLISLDKILRQALIGPLVNAANDGAAATAGVPINGMYRNGSVIQIRVT